MCAGDHAGGGAHRLEDAGFSGSASQLIGRLGPVFNLQVADSAEFPSIVSNES
jgi:hypothetical protein